MNKCKIEYEERAEQKKNNFFYELSDLPKLTADTLWKMTEYGMSEFVKNGDLFEQLVEDTSAYRLSLVVEDLEISEEYDKEEVYIAVVDLTRVQGRFCLHCKAVDFENDMSSNAEFYFSNPKVKIIVLNCSEISGLPWNGGLCYVADEIVNKSKLSVSLCNDEEIELLPLLKEIASLDRISDGERYIKKFVIHKKIILNVVRLFPIKKKLIK